jgi:hypothetical protein
VPAISTNDLKNGITLNLDGTLYTVVEFQHVKPGKGGAFVRSKLRNLRSNNMLEKTFNAGVKVEQAILEKSDMQFLYKDGEEYVFMELHLLSLEFRVTVCQVLVSLQHCRQEKLFRFHCSSTLVTASKSTRVVATTLRAFDHVNRPTFPLGG